LSKVKTPKEISLYFYSLNVIQNGSTKRTRPMGNIKIGSLIARGSKDAWPDIFFKQQQQSKNVYSFICKAGAFFKII
jgi:hypothetical protein